MKFLDKLWPYILGAAMLCVAVILGPKFIHKADDVRPSPSLNGAVPQGSTNVAATQTPQDQLPGGLQPIMLEKPSEAMYLLVAEALVKKLKPASLLLTYSENKTLNSATASALRTNLGLVLPSTYVVPASIPKTWVDSPHLDTMLDYQYKWALYNANTPYIQKITSTLIDDYSSKTISILSDQFSAITKSRKRGDMVALQFIKDLYGLDYMNSYFLSHLPVETRPGLSKPTQFPDKLNTDQEAELASYWRTEFSDEDFVQVKQYIISNGLGDKLQSDLQHSDLPEAEKGLLESSILGYRINSMHELTCTLVAAYSARGTTMSNYHH